MMFISIDRWEIFLKGNSLYKINSSLTSVSLLYYGDGEILDLKFNSVDNLLYILFDYLNVYYVDKISP